MNLNFVLPLSFSLLCAVFGMLTFFNSRRLLRAILEFERKKQRATASVHGFGKYGKSRKERLLVHIVGMIPNRVYPCNFGTNRTHYKYGDTLDVWFFPLDNKTRCACVIDIDNPPAFRMEDYAIELGELSIMFFVLSVMLMFMALISVAL